MLVYITSGQKTDITTINMDGLPLHHLSVGRGYLARRRAVRWLRELHASGVRRCICADAALLPLAEQVDITPYPVLPLRLALLDGLLDVLCPGGLQNAAVLLRCGRGGEAAARAAAPVLARRARYLSLDDPPHLLAQELPGGGWDYSGKTADPDQTAMLYMMRAQSLSNLDGLYSYYSLYPKYSHGFVATVPMYTPAGSGMYWTDVQVDPDKRQGSGQILHGQDEWFACDVTATGEVTVRALTDYVTPDGAMTYQTMKEWYELGDKTEFAVSGCYSDYIKMLMTSIGQDYAPYVFLLTENGNVEYIDVISGAQCGTMVNGGPLFGINGIVRFETGTAYDAEYGAEYATVYGVSRDNEKFNLMEAVWNTAPLSIPSMVGSFVSEDTGTWFEICEDQPNFYTGAYTNGQRIPATWDSSISYLGMDDRGWICSVSLFRMDSGRTQRETLAMMPDDYGGVNVMHIGGESLLNLPQQEAVWFEMTQE